MGLFGKSFDEKVQDAMEAIEGMGFDAWDLGAAVDGKVVTLTGTARNLEVKTLIMMEFNNRVEADNTLNMIRVEEKPHVAAPVEEPTVRVDALQPEEATIRVDVDPNAPKTDDDGNVIYEVVPGDTLGGIAKSFYGKANLYMKIFDANRDILDNPDLIKVGQKLRIPKV